MGRLLRQEDSDIKARLVSEICFISTAFISCPHRRHLLDSDFIDWYRLLGVGGDAEIDVKRKRCRQLVVQLHPDKNKYLKAETAFKLVSEIINLVNAMSTADFVLAMSLALFIILFWNILVAAAGLCWYNNSSGSSLVS